MLQRGSYLFYYRLTDKQKKFYKDFPRDRQHRVLSKKTGKPIRVPYKIKVFNTINFDKSLHYNPFAYIKTEQDILKFVNTLITNTKGDGAQSGEDFWVKAERLLFTAYTAYIVNYCEPNERNFVSLPAMIDASETREDDENFDNAIDLMFKDIEFSNIDEGIEADPDSFAVRQYKKYKLAAGKTAKSILISCGARLAPFDIQEIRDITSYDELDLGDIGVHKTALFIIISDTDDVRIATGNIFYSMIMHCAFNTVNVLFSYADIGNIPIWIALLVLGIALIGFVVLTVAFFKAHGTEMSINQNKGKYKPYEMITKEGYIAVGICVSVICMLGISG